MFQKFLDFFRDMFGAIDDEPISEEKARVIREDPDTQNPIEHIVLGK